MMIEFVVEPAKEQCDAIYQGLLNFNSPHFPDREITKVACFVKNSKGELAGGLTGEIFSNTFYIQYFWLDESCRGEGLGSQVFAKAEREAAALGATDIYLDTYSFQAAGFYLKLGFRQVGKYSGFPTKGVDKIFLQKSIED
ncbi:GNAT family N-acetyltransferase [Vibrio sp. SCSIO 43137]|uniref:GNAT family N-acetyltransferase n=1 Tax=Vibrio sp. SCSIO 43137 TaxID=3021011 RepID=UPI0023073DC9|nr:GNAT family N-acetyltransferase [Vibrio sp. SCSIO 43137]WCE28646.1 GNAT family N-acetyltransferase [Vibrio sp. SCSIO 43137]